MYYTYAYLREDGTPYYIGKGTKGRIYENKGRPCGRPKDISKVIFLKQNITEQEAFKHEIYMIAVFGRKDLETGILHNRTDGGEGVSGLVVSEETKRKISEANKGNNYNLGKTHSEERKRKQSEAQKGEKGSFYGKTHSEETKRKISEATKGNTNMLGKTHSEEIRRKIGEVTKNTKWWNDGCGNRKRMVECPGDAWRPGRK